MSTRGSYSPRKLGTIIDMAHIIIGILIMVMACFAILRPARYMFLFPNRHSFTSPIAHTFDHVSALDPY